MKLRVAIVDDEPLARSRLRRWIRLAADFEIVAECEDGSAAVEAVLSNDIDVLFLDIHMPGMDGFDVLRKLPPERLPWTIFVTAYDEHAVRAFEERALDYLLKPISRARLAAALARVRAKFDSTQVRERFHEWLAERAAADRIAVPHGDRTIFVPTSRIDWIESAGNYALVHAGSQTHILRETLNELENQLPAERFFRVSRSAIVNVGRIHEVEARDGQNCIHLESGTVIPISRSRRELAKRIVSSR